MEAGSKQEQESFDAWKESEEFKAIAKFLETRSQNEQVDQFDNAYKDIWEDFQPALDDLFAVV